MVTTVLVRVTSVVRSRMTVGMNVFTNKKCKINLKASDYYFLLQLIS